MRLIQTGSFRVALRLFGTAAQRFEDKREEAEADPRKGDPDGFRNTHF